MLRTKFECRCRRPKLSDTSTPGICIKSSVSNKIAYERTFTTAKLETSTRILQRLLAASSLLSCVSCFCFQLSRSGDLHFLYGNNCWSLICLDSLRESELHGCHSFWCNPSPSGWKMWTCWLKMIGHYALWHARQLRQDTEQLPMQLRFS